MNPITRKETFLAAAGGQDVTTPTPITREEVFLDAIAKGGGGSSLPSTETASAGDLLSLDENKEPQWATPSGGGGVLVVHETHSGTVGTLDKTFKQIEDGMTSGGVVIVTEVGAVVSTYIVRGIYKESGVYEVYSPNDVTYSADSEDGYPYHEY